MKVFKYVLQAADHQQIHAPIGMTPLSVMVQLGQVCLWAMVDPEKPNTIHDVWVHGTGHEVYPPVAGNFVGSFQLHGGSLVFHVFCKPVK